jgi:hypothetical protein
MRIVRKDAAAAIFMTRSRIPNYRPAKLAMAYYRVSEDTLPFNT